MKRYLGIFLLCTAGIFSAAAATQTATVTEVAGKVECKLPGNDWKTAKVGDTLPAGSFISTGFKSTAIIKTESATLTVKPVTRLSLEELIKSEGTTKTQMFLMAGRVKAEVTPKEGEKAEFKVKSPTATASVRGTGFEFDGQNLLVDHGAVQFESGSGIGIPKMVASGEFSTISRMGTVTTPVAVATNSSDNQLQAAQAASVRTESGVKSSNGNRYTNNENQQTKPVVEEERNGSVTIGIGWDD
ncbi:hypothetical protein DWB79_11580 [Treponema medium]|uniref:FecR protein domain-containing protein n=2 Tax=Treponema medium TaxID=58231 RepID=A0AA87TE38_TREMD|nr:FecR domain-containing protein [Treponema medium]EPF27779.1 hypothetical protein HMPREF9195_02280 [Treponema medium ATCC 700293]QSH98374.1 hypothetical protein DWB79_11580 [Treponema medium]